MNVNPRSIYNKVEDFHTFVNVQGIDCVFMSELWERPEQPLTKVSARMQLLRSVRSFGATIKEMVHLWKLFCLSVLEQSFVVWGSSITQENEEDLERTQKSFVRIVLGDKYSNY